MRTTFREEEIRRVKRDCEALPNAYNAQPAAGLASMQWHNKEAWKPALQKANLFELAKDSACRPEEVEDCDVRSRTSKVLSAKIQVQDRIRDQEGAEAFYRGDPKYLEKTLRRVQAENNRVYEKYRQTCVDTGKFKISWAK